MPSSLHLSSPRLASPLGPSLPTLPLLVLLAGACAEPAAPDSPEPPAPADATSLGDSATPADVSLPAALQARGFAVQPGAFEFLDLSSCCTTTCSGNNPSSPYASFFLPPAPGQTAPNPSPRPDGLASSYHLRADEAVVYLGVMPPEAAYYGFTPYLMQRSDRRGAPRSIFASLSETLNQRVIVTEGSSPFEQRAALIVAADATTTELARQALVASGVRDAAINVITLDPAVGRFGLSATSDAFGVLFRLALVTDEAKRAAYLANPGGTVLRITPTTPRPFVPLPSPPPRTKATSPTETALRPAVDRLGAAIAAAHPGYAASDVPVDVGTPDPASCIANLTFCGGDNRDTNYPGTAPRVLFASDDDFYVVYGVNHQLSGKTSYSNASVYALEKLVGLVSVASDEYPGSAAAYLPADPAAPVLYAWKLARRCGAFEPFCLEVPKGGCPTGMPNGALGTITFRTYLEPSSKTAPLMSTLVRDRIWAFRKR